MAKNIENDINEVVEQETVKKSPAKKQTRKFDPTETFPCRSVCYGELILEGYKSKILYTWANCGDYADVEYQDLQALQSRKSRFLTDPLFVIEDEDGTKRSFVRNFRSLILTSLHFDTIDDLKNSVGMGLKEGEMNEE